jgi:hypothetical protein
MLVITLDAANLISAANWAANGKARLHASILELGLLAATVMVLVISIHILRKSQSPYEEQETKRSEGSQSALPG